MQLAPLPRSLPIGTLLDTPIDVAATAIVSLYDTNADQSISPLWEIGRSTTTTFWADEQGNPFHGYDPTKARLATQVDMRSAASLLKRAGAAANDGLDIAEVAAILRTFDVNGDGKLSSHVNGMADPSNERDTARRAIGEEIWISETSIDGKLVKVEPPQR